MPPSPHSILFIAGDVSGDVHTAALARTALEHDPSLVLYAMGGARLREAVTQSKGGQFFGDTSHCSAIGLVSAIKIYFRCSRLRARLHRFLARHKVNAVVLCDWGAFNGRIVRELYERGLPVLYYFPPRSWQRSGSSGLGIVPFVNRVATPFPWSAEQLQAAGCRAEWVGHPSLENVKPSTEREKLRLRFGVQPEETLVALMPGSRRSEISILGPRMAQTAALLNRERAVRCVAVVPRELTAEARKYLPDSIQILTDCAPDLLQAADAAVVKTGTSSLEAVLANVPQVAVYDASIIGRIEWVLLWAWKRIPYYAMPNIILEREAVPELLGLKCKPSIIAAAVRRLLDIPQTRRRMLDDYARIRKALGSELPEAPTERTSHILVEMLEETASGARPMAAAV